MRMVYEYELRHGVNTLTLQEGVEFLSVSLRSYQDGSHLDLVVLQDLDVSIGRKRFFRAILTGEGIPDGVDVKFIGTGQGHIAYHVFEEIVHHERGA